MLPVQVEARPPGAASATEIRSAQLLHGEQRAPHDLPVDQRKAAAASCRMASVSGFRVSDTRLRVKYLGFSTGFGGG